LFDLTDERSLIDRSAEGTKIVMQADALDFPTDAVELEAVDGVNLNGADAEPRRQLVNGIILIVKQRGNAFI
jgi:hypothetical protein